MTELETKLARVQTLLDQYHLDGLALQRVSSFAWATAGASSYINTATTNGEASLLITKDGHYLFTNNIEAPRYEKEEALHDQGWQFEVDSWDHTNGALERFTKSLRLGSDGNLAGAVDLSMEIAMLRMNLLPEEQTRFREVSQQCAQAMEAAARAVRPGMSEYEIAAILAREAYQRGVLPIVNLVATDDRIYGYRHPLPTSKKMEKYAMLVLGGRKYGLVASVTRLIHYGPISDMLKEKQAAVAQVDAQIIAATRPGVTLAEVYAHIQKAYAQSGFPEEYKLHHQGGSTGYEPREFLATPNCQAVVAAGQVYAWNPSITGTKSEDSVLITEQGVEVLTSMSDWPTQAVQVNGTTFQRPIILEV